MVIDSRLAHIKTQEIPDEWWERCEGAYCEWCRINDCMDEPITQTEGRIIVMGSKSHNAQVAFVFCNKQHGRLWIEWLYNSPRMIAEMYMSDYKDKVASPNDDLIQ